MKIILDIADDFVPSLDMHLSTQRRIDTDPATGGQIVTPLYKDIPDFLQQSVGQIVRAIGQQFPSPALRTKLLALKAIQEEIEAMARPAVVDPQTFIAEAAAK